MMDCVLFLLHNWSHCHICSYMIIISNQSFSVSGVSAGELAEGGLFIFFTVHLQLQPTRVAQARARGCDMHWGPVWIPTPPMAQMRKHPRERLVPVGLQQTLHFLCRCTKWDCSTFGRTTTKTNGLEVFSQAIIILTVKCVVDISRVHEVCKSTNITSGASSCIAGNNRLVGQIFRDTHETWVPQIIWSYPCNSMHLEAQKTWEGLAESMRSQEYVPKCQDVLGQN